MNFKIPVILFIFIFLFSACDSETENEVVIEGEISVPSQYIDKIKGPVFTAVSKTDDIEALENDPARYIEAIAQADTDTGRYSLSLKNTGILPGDEVFLFAFADNDYKGWIPNPTKGDLMGVFTDKDSFRLMYTAGSDKNPDIILNRIHYGTEFIVTGFIDSYENGDIILIAYSGNFDSADFSSINADNIYAYKKMKNFKYPQNFTMNILPYGLDPENSELFIIGLLDKNKNSIPDEGDIIGFALTSDDRSEIKPVKIDNYTVYCGVIEFDLPVNTKADYTDSITVKGSFNQPDNYTINSPPVFTAAVKSTDLSEAAEIINNLSVEKFDFSRVEPGKTDFNLCLSSKKFKPEDQVIIFALWDKDYKSGLPSLNYGDMIGVLSDKKNFSYTSVLQESENTIYSSKAGDFLFNNEPGFSFSIDRNFYDYNLFIKFKLEKGSLSDEEFTNGANIVLTAVYEEGEVGPGYEIEMDKVVAVSSERLKTDGDFSSYCKLLLLPALNSEIPVEKDNEFILDNIYIFALLDENNNGKQDDGEKTAYYWKQFEFIGIPIPGTYVPAPVKIPGETGLILDKTVRFN
jgi:hypothetical protein